MGEKQAEQQEPRKLTFRGKIFGLMFIICLLLAVLLIQVVNYYSQTTVETATDYPEITQKTTVEKSFRSSRETSILVTPNAAINQNIVQLVHDVTQRAIESAPTKPSIFSRFKLEQTIDCRITYFRENILSVVISARWQYGELTQTEQVLRTFDFTNGQPLMTADLFKNSLGFTQTFLADINRKLPSDQATDLAQISLAENQQNFVITRDGFWKLQLGKTEVSLSLSDYLKAFKPELLVRVFDEQSQTEKLPELATQRGDFCQKNPCVALTFDDGPTEQTPRLLDILRQQRVPVTFFVLGSAAERHPETIERAVNEGHRIGNHSWSHLNLRHKPAGQVAFEIDRANQTIERLSGEAPRLMRPPYGAYDQSVLNKLRANGQAAILWSVDPRDWDTTDVNLVVERATGAATNGSIILLHDNHASTVDAVESIIQDLRTRGFYFVTVETLFGGSVEAGERYFHN